MKVEFLISDEHITAVYEDAGVPVDERPPSIWAESRSREAEKFKRGPSNLHPDIFEDYEHTDRIPERLEELALEAEEAGERFSERSTRRWPIIHEMHEHMFQRHVGLKDMPNKD